MVTERLATCFHEAGHVAMAMHFGYPVLDVWVVPCGRGIGEATILEPNKNCKWHLERKLLITLAGAAAEALFVDDDSGWNVSLTYLKHCDLECAEHRATQLRQFVKVPGCQLIERYLDRAGEILSSDAVWPAVVGVAGLLDSRERIREAELLTIAAEYSLAPQICDSFGPLADLI